MFQGSLRLFRNIDLAFPKPLNQIVRREIDQFDRIRAVENRIRHSLAHSYMSDLGHDIVETFDVLDVYRRIYVDSSGEQFLDIKIALRMATAGRIGVGEFIDQRDFWVTRDKRIEVHFLEQPVSIFKLPSWNAFKVAKQRFSLRAAVGLDDAHHHISAGLPPGVRALQHGVGLSDTRGGANEDLQPALMA